LADDSPGGRCGTKGTKVDLQDPANGIIILRKWRSWSLEDLAAKVGVSPEQVRTWEVGQMPSEDELRILEKLLSE
jgi:ribosome-binding protein aMBF1 (putative translation factor)